MQRRDFFKNILLFSAAGLVLPKLQNIAYALDVLPASSPLLNGVIPAGANPAISTLFKFNHYHFLYLPTEIMGNPPAQGYTTATSMVVPRLGVSPTLINQKRQFHYHEVTFTQKQIIDIKVGKPTTIDIYLGGQLNHRFFFNKPLAFGEQVNELERVAITKGLPRQLKGPVVPLRVV